jgi:hypothetical protein
MLHFKMGIEKKENFMKKFEFCTPSVQQRKQGFGLKFGVTVSNFNFFGFSVQVVQVHLDEQAIPTRFHGIWFKDQHGCIGRRAQNAMADAKEVLKVHSILVFYFRLMIVHDSVLLQRAVEGSIAHCGAVFDASGAQIMTYKAPSYYFISIHTST